MIELRNVSLTFDREEILRDVNLRVESGERLVIIGPSGQGKSMLLKLMSGIIHPTRGEVLINGQNLEEISAYQRNQARRKMGMLFQKNALFDSLTCYENVIFPLQEVTQISQKDADAKVLNLLDRVGLSHAVKLYPDEISGGMQKRLGIARALALEPDIIFYDDPTAGLDPITSRRIIELILELQEQRKSTLVAITNDMNRAYQLGHRILMVTDQQALIAGTPAETRATTNLQIKNFINGISSERSR
ncbi:MAG: ATP-binding cassette domain-containing protein [Bdellovibrionota bacterium]